MHAHIQHLTDRDLIAAIDGELTGRHQRAVDAHLRECNDCRERRVRMETAASSLSELFESADAPSGGLTAARQRLHAAMRDSGGHSRLPAFSRSSIVRWVGVGAACVAIFLMLREPPSRHGHRLDAELAALTSFGSSTAAGDALPVASLTPGATWNVSVAELCSTEVRPQRPIDLDVKLDVLRAYRMEDVPADQYELDYLITPELGGAADARNLWPQRYRSRVWNAYVKDQLERMLPGKVCRGEIDLVTAQQEIAADWVSAYKKYFDTDFPIHLRARLSAGDHADSPNAQESPESPERHDEGDDITYPVWRPSGGPALKLVAFNTRP